jgi:outer membrane protein assembly factor BamB
VTETFVYVACEGGMVALKFTLGTHPRFTAAWRPNNGSPEGPPVVAGGYVWQFDWDSGILYAMNPVDGAVKWSRNTTNLNHFATPTVIDGHVFIPTADGVQAFVTG